MPRIAPARARGAERRNTLSRCEPDMDVAGSRRHVAPRIIALVALALGASTASAQTAPPTQLGEAEWIWSATATKDKAPTGACYFRKTFDAAHVEIARVQISCDDRYELIVNGRAIGSGSDWRVMQSFDITKFVTPGRHLIAIRAENTTGGSAGLVARVTVKTKGATEVSHSSAASWKPRTSEAPGWERPGFNDSQWAAARSLGEFGATEPW